jgi:hypothetical protein
MVLEAVVEHHDGVVSDGTTDENPHEESGNTAKNVAEL